MNVFDYGSEEEDLSGSERFWTVVLVLLYGASIVQLVLGNFMLGISNLGLSVVFTIVAYQKFWKGEGE